MSLWQAILANVAEKQWGEIMQSEIEKLLEKECYKILDEIKAVLEDDGLDDEECFERIEKMVCIFEKAGSGCGTRHDFG